MDISTWDNLTARMGNFSSNAEYNLAQLSFLTWGYFKRDFILGQIINS